MKDKSPQNFGAALEYFPNEYKELASTVQVEYTDEKGDTKHDTGIYSLFRCGMVHEYFIKGRSIIYNNPYGPTESHIGIKKANGGKFEFHTNEYFRDFKLAVDKIYKLLVLYSNSILTEGFNKSLDRLDSRKVL